eukprot:Gb_22986 [translate_table: standard]
MVEVILPIRCTAARGNPVIVEYLVQWRCHPVNEVTWHIEQDMQAYPKLIQRFLKTYIFKLMKSSGVTESGESEKVLLLVESGVRLHTTVFVRDKSTTPSGFTLKLRKHIRTRRLEDVRQLGIDRVVDFQFGLGKSAHHIILELYAQGNLLLTDSDYDVLTLLRTHRHALLIGVEIDRDYCELKVLCMFYWMELRSIP